DPGQIEQVIMNLAVNARDAMPKGGRIAIETANVDLDESYAQKHMPAVPGRYVVLTVSDTGMGMDEATKAHIFEPFFTTKEKGRGTGLGLSTVYGIVKQSGGYIWVYSEPGTGTSFKVYLPRVDEVAAPLAAPPPSPRIGGSETILLVEDEGAVRALARRVLEAGGYRVLVAGNGEEALELASCEPARVHLLVTDLVLPGIGGFEVATRIRKLVPGLKVLYTSGYSDDLLARQGFVEKGAAFLAKPFTPGGLTQKIRQTLDA
ncbi:MAG: ATP-binding protein, partial [Acidobacteriota bacterium]